jgi:hypothetical protein
VAAQSVLALISLLLGLVPGTQSPKFFYWSCWSWIGFLGISANFSSLSWLVFLGVQWFSSLVVPRLGFLFPTRFSGLHHSS